MVVHAGTETTRGRRERANRAGLLGSTALAAVLALGLAGPALGQTFDWVGGTDGAYNDQTNWNPNNDGFPDAAGETATFGDVTGSTAITVSAGPHEPDSWTFDADADDYIFSGGTVNFAIGIVDNNTAGTITIGTQIGGAGATVQKNGAGTLDLSNTLNSYSGGTTVSAGQITAVVAGSLGATTGSVTVSGTGTLDLGGDTHVQNGGLTLSGGTVQNGTLQSSGTFAVQSGTVAADATLSGTGNVSKTTSGTVIFAGANSYTGTTTVSAGTLSVSASNNLGNGSATNDLIFNGGTLQTTASVDLDSDRETIVQAGGGGFNVNAGTTLTVSGLITGASGVQLNKSGGGTLLLTGSNTVALGESYLGAVNVTDGTFHINGATNFGDFDGGAVTTTITVGDAVNAPVLLLGGGGITNNVNANIVGNSGGTISAGNSPGTTTVATYTLNGGTALFEMGTPGVIGGGVNDLVNVTGQLDINSGTLQLTNGTTDDQALPGLYRLFNYGSIDTFNFTAIVDDAGGAYGTTPSVYLGDGGVNVRVFGAGQLTQYWDGSDTTNAAAGAQGGAGTWNVGNTNWVDDPVNGVIRDFWRGERGVFGGAGGAVAVSGIQGFQNLEFDVGSYVVSGDNLELNGSETSATDPSEINVDGAGAISATIDSIIANGTSSALNKTGPDTLILTGENTYTGATRIEEGILQLGTGGTVGRLGFGGGTAYSDLFIDSDGQLLIDRTDLVGSPYTYGGDITGDGAIVQTNTGTTLFNGTNSAFAGTVDISGGGQLVLDTLLGGTDLTVTGATTILAGAGGFDGDVTFDAATGGIFNPGSISGGASQPGTFTVGGNLVLDDATEINMQFATANSPGGGINDLISVEGGLTLDGTLNVTHAGATGYYRVINFRTGGAGAFTDNGLALGTVAPGVSSARIYVIEPGAPNRGEVNLALNLGGQVLHYWDGNGTQTGDGVAEGGDGTWSAGNVNWTDAPTGSNFNDVWAGTPSGTTTGAVAVFLDPTNGGEVVPHTVTTSGVQDFDGLWFDGDGYLINGTGLRARGNSAPTVTFPDPNMSIINVVDAGETATIATAISGLNATTGVIKIGDGTLILTADNTYTGNTTVSAGTLRIQGDGTSPGPANIDSPTTTNNATLDLNAGGDVGGDVINNATLTVTDPGGPTGSTIGGDLNNNGTATIFAGATLTVTGNLNNNTGGTVTNNGTVFDDLNNAAGALVTNNAVWNGNVATNFGVASANNPYVTNPDFGIVNNGTWTGNVLSNNGTITNNAVWAGAVNNNAGTWVAINGNTSAGAFTNNSTITMQDGATNDNLTVASYNAASTGGNVNVDINLGPGGGTADVLTNNGAFEGSTTFNFANIGAGAILQNPILVMDNSGPTNGTAVAGTGLPNAGLVNYALNKLGDDWFVVSTLNLGAVGGVAGNVAIVQSTLGAIVNRPSSPFVTGLAAQVEPGYCGAGPWMRGTGGAVRASGTTTSDFPNTPPSNSTVDMSFGGAQFGLDLACFNVNESMLDVAFGAIGGFNRGYSSQAVPNAGTTASDFSQGYAGAYATVGKGGFAADIQARVDLTDFNFDNPLIQLNNANLTTTRFTVSGSASYSMPVESLEATFVPTAGFSLSRTTATTLVFTPGQGLQSPTLAPNPSLSIIGFVGGTLAKTTIAPEGNMATTPFVTGTVYNDFAPNPTAVFTDPNSGLSQNITSQHLGWIAEGSVGVNWVWLNEEPGAKQISATVRADVKASNRLLGGALTGQLRGQF